MDSFKHISSICGQHVLRLFHVLKIPCLPFDRRQPYGLVIITIINIKTHQHGNAPIMYNSSKIMKRKKTSSKNCLCCKFCLAADAVNSIHIIHQAQAASVSFPSPHSKFSCHFCGHGLDACGIAVLTQNVVIQWVASSTFSL